MPTRDEQSSKTHIWIKAELRRRGTNMAELSRSIGVTQGSVSLVSQGLHRSKRIELELAKAVDMTPQVLFPDRYSVNCDKDR